MELVVTIQDPVVIDFFKSNPQLDPKDVLASMVKLIKKCTTVATESHIISAIKELTNSQTAKFDEIKSKITSQNQHTEQAIANITNELQHITLKMQSSFSETESRLLRNITDALDMTTAKHTLRIDTLETTINNHLNGASTRDIIQAILELKSLVSAPTVTQDLSFDKLQGWMHDTFLDTLRLKIQDCSFSDIAEARQSLALLLQKSTADAEGTKHVIDRITHLQTTINQTTQTQQDTLRTQTDFFKSITNGVAGQLSRTEQEFTDIRRQLVELLTIKNDMTSLTEALRVFANPTKTAAKGVLAENVVETALTQLFPTHVVKRVASNRQRGNMDFQITKTGYPTVMIDVKKYAKGIPEREIKKFHDDMALGKRHAIMLCIECKVPDRAHLELELTGNGTVAVYLNNVTFQDMSDMLRAVNLIYTIDNIVQRYKTENGTGLSTAQIEHANEQIRSHLNSVRLVQDHLRQSLSLIDDMLRSGLASVLTCGGTKE